MNVTDFGELLNGRPEPTPEQYADARAYVTAHAPDLLAAIFGEGEL